MKPSYTVSALKLYRTTVQCIVTRYSVQLDCQWNAGSEPADHSDKKVLGRPPELVANAAIVRFRDSTSISGQDLALEQASAPICIKAISRPALPKMSPTARKASFPSPPG
jgi:hypothetical protein